MKYWWVNQKQTYGQESSGGYMWSPKTSSSGGRIQYYENMREVRPGDIVYSYVGGQIVSAGIIQSVGYSSPKPTNFGAAGDGWSQDGWCVDVEYHELANRIRPKQHMDRIRPLLPERYSPLQANGNGNQVYLCSISKELGELLAGLIGQEAQQVVAGIGAADHDEFNATIIEQEILASSDISETEKHQLVKSRRGQGLFRTRLEAIELGCRLTGVTQKNHLVASHMKPWSVSNNFERLDGANGLLLAPHVDHLFDKGYISFTDNGDLIISNSLDIEVIRAWGLLRRNVGNFSQAQRQYMTYHRENILKK